MESALPPSVVIVFTTDFSEDDVAFARSGLLGRGFDRQYRLQSSPPKLTAAFPDDMSRQGVDEVVVFLQTVPHSEIRLSYPSSSGLP